MTFLLVRLYFKVSHLHIFANNFLFSLYFYTLFKIIFFFFGIFYFTFLNCISGFGISHLVYHLFDVYLIEFIRLNFWGLLKVFSIFLRRLHVLQLVQFLLFFPFSCSAFFVGGPAMLKAVYALWIQFLSWVIKFAFEHSQVLGVLILCSYRRLFDPHSLRSDPIFIMRNCQWMIF